MNTRHQALMDEAFSTDKEAAALLGVSPRTIHRWRTGERPVPHATMLAISLFAAQNRWNDIVDNANYFAKDYDADTPSEAALYRMTGIRNTVENIIEQAR